MEGTVRGMDDASEKEEGGSERNEGDIAMEGAREERGREGGRKGARK